MSTKRVGRIGVGDMSSFSITASQVSVVNVDFFGVLQVYSISVGTILRGRDGQVVNHDSLTAIELEMALGAVDNRYPCYCDIGTAIKPQCLHQSTQCFICNYRNVQSAAIIVFLT